VPTGESRVAVEPDPYLDNDVHQDEAHVSSGRGCNRLTIIELVVTPPDRVHGRAFYALPCQALWLVENARVRVFGALRPE